MSQSTVNAVLLSADLQDAQEERVDRRTGEKYDARPEGGTLYILDSDNGIPVITKIKCSPRMARKYQAENSLRVGEPLRLTTLLIDVREYKLDNGKQGLTRQLVEGDSESAKPRGSFKLEPAPRAEARPAQAPPPMNANGQRLAAGVS